MRQAGQDPLWARAGTVLGDSQEEHPEIQQLHLAHRVTPRPPLAKGGRSQRPSLRWEEVWNQGKGHPFYILPHLLAPPPFPFCSSLFFFDGVHFDLCCHVALCKTTTTTCRRVKVRLGTATIDHSTVNETCVQCVICTWCMFIENKQLLHFYEVTKILGRFRKEGTNKVMVTFSSGR